MCIGYVEFQLTIKRWICHAMPHGAFDLRAACRSLRYIDGYRSLHGRRWVAIPGGPFQSVNCRVPQRFSGVGMLSPSNPILTRRLGRPGYSGQTKIFLFNLPLVVYAFLARLNTTSEYGRLFMFGLLGVLIIGLIV